MIYADGVPDQRSYTKNDGTQGIALTLRILNIQLLGSSSKNENGEPTSGSNNENPVLIAVGSDDLPFWVKPKWRKGLRNNGL